MYITDFEENGVVTRDDLDSFIQMCRNLSCDRRLVELLNELEEIVFYEYHLSAVNLFMNKHNVLRIIRTFC